MNITKCIILVFVLATTITPEAVGGDSRDSRIDSLRRRLQREQNDSTRVELQIDLSRLEHRKTHHEDDCIGIAALAMEKAATLANTTLYAKGLDNLGLLYRYHHRYAQALRLHMKAFDLIEHEAAPPLSKMIYANNTGVAARHNGDNDIAVNYYLKSLAIATRADDEKNMEIASNGLGIALMSLPGRGEEALDYLHQALEIAKGAGNKRGQAMNYFSIGGYYDKVGQHDKARGYFRELQLLNEEMDDENGMAISLQAIGNSFLTEGNDLPAAQSYFRQAQQRFKEVGNDVGEAQTLNSLGEIFFRNQQLTQALSFFRQSMEVGVRLNNKRLIKNSAEMMSRIYEEQHNTSEAFNYFKIAQLYKDSLALMEQETAIMAIKTRYDFESKETEIELLTKDKTLREAQLKSSALIIYLMAGVLILLLGLIFFLVRIRRIRRKAIMLIEAQKRDKLKAQYEKSVMEAEMIATRMQVNPHFMFNSLNAIKFMIQSNENAKAMGYLVTFSRFIRSVLETSEQPVHTVATELRLLEGFLRLEENRFDGDFSYRVSDEVEQWADRKTLPALLLQPFVENAIWHGLLASERSDKRIAICSRSDANGIVITIEDNGVGFVKSAPSRDGHTSMGHRITDKRIELYNSNFPDHIEWHIESIADAEGQPSGTRVQLIIRIDAHHDSDRNEPNEPLITEIITETT
ncbi:tetratricopeptide repeat protein [Parapedobacter sp. 10938]|uniref:tetratricopeptide repeat protein n=1 Tax=Parapedobacter flavus TaxID=3110225 RepID=UPI002DBC3B29|nr:tetratricopeptide repeat protein [Parapedobacter sp. 10938]MEC3879193.1 tetratricopeptide repeat protein [Parapedobacter sp. 10938]